MPNQATASGLQWPLSPDDFYLPANHHRPVMQGDVFTDVPFVKAKRGNKLTDSPAVSSERRTVAVLGYPCDIYNSATWKLAKVQTIALVVNADKVGIPENWDGAYQFAPLPDLFGDGVTHAVDLRATANIDAFCLDVSQRQRCLSELGWATFRQRLGLARTRLLNHLSDLTNVGSSLWQEMDLWTQWNQAERSAPDFQRWLDEREVDLGGFTRRIALYRGMHETVRESLISALQS